jgi:hypothetical protein
MNEEPVSWLLGADDVLELPEALPVEVVPTGCDDIGFAIEDMDGCFSFLFCYA